MRVGIDHERDSTLVCLVQQARRWLADADFTGVRGPQAFAQLPEAEREPWHKLWDDVASLLARGQAAPQSPPTIDQIQKMIDAKSYRPALRAIAQILSITTPASAEPLTMELLYAPMTVNWPGAVDSTMIESHPDPITEERGFNRIGVVEVIAA